MAIHTMRLGAGYGGEVFVYCTGCTDLDFYSEVDTVNQAHAHFAHHLARRYHRGHPFADGGTPGPPVASTIRRLAMVHGKSRTVVLMARTVGATTDTRGTDG